jgi:ribosome-associated translation inhibitor RaiA
VTTSDFEFEFYSEVPHLSPALRAEAENQLRELTVGHTDILGASVAMEELTGSTTPHRYEARVVMYMKPDNVAAVEKGETAQEALKGALNAVERQVREYRDKLREPWKQP